MLPTDSKGNPYHDLLIARLEDCGVRVLGITNVSRRVLFLGRLLAFRPHCVHFHWLHPFFMSRHGVVAQLRFGLFLAQFLLIKGLRLPVVWTVHNYGNHERRHPRLERRMNRLLEYNADAVIVHCAAAREILERSFDPVNRKKVRVVPHGNYIGAYPEHIHREAAREAMGLDQEDLVYLFLGGIRRYKGVLELVRAFKAMDPEHRLTLILAGHPQDREVTKELSREIDGDPRIRAVFQFVADEDVQRYMNAADVVVAPFQDVLTSGSVILAMSFGRAIVAPRIGCIPELVTERGGFLYEPRDPDGLGSALNAVVHHSDSLASMGSRNRRAIAAHDWRSVAEKTRDVYASLQARAGV